MKDHEIREFTNELTMVAKKYAHTQQLRERISRIVLKNLERPCSEEGADTGTEETLG